MSSPESNQPTESGALQLEVVQPSNSGDAIAPPSPKLSEPNIAYRMISKFAAEGLRQAADALDAGMPELARHHATKALDQIYSLANL